MRKLAVFSVAFAAAVFVAHYILPGGYFTWAAVMCALFSLLGFLFRAEKSIRVILICLGAAAGFVVSGVSYAQKIEPSAAITKEDYVFTAEVSEYPYQGEGYSSVRAKNKSENLPKVDVIIYFYDFVPPEMRPGDIIEVSGSLRFAGERYGQSWDARIADNVYLLAYPESLEVTGRAQLAFLYFPQSIRKAIVEMALKVFPKNSAPLLVALLTGEVNLLYDDVELYTEMKATGIYHIVSVSGMHVAFLVGFLRLILRRRKTASLIGIPAVWLFAVIMGGGPSIIRAAFMQTAVLAAPLLKRESDGITSLTAILAILLAINPGAVASVSLQLSFSATLGMVLITPRANKYPAQTLAKRRKQRKKARGGRESIVIRIGYKILYAVIASFAATIGALAFSTPVMAYYFGCVTTYSIIVNILVFWTVSACFVLGFISCFLGMLWLPPGIGAGAVTGLLAEYIIAVVRFFGGLPFARVYVNGGYFLFWLVFCYGAFIVWALLRRGKRFRPIIPSALVLSSLFLGVILLQLSAKSAPPRFTAVDVGQGQSIVVTSGTSALVIDCGGKGTPSNAGDTVAAYLLSRGIQSVEALCITHFDSDHVNGAIRLMANIEVKRLVIAAENEADTYRDEIIAFAEKKGVEVYIISESTKISFADIELLMYTPVSRAKPELIFLAAAGDYDILVTGDADEAAEKRFLLTQDVPDVDIFVAGHHGSKSSSSMELLEAIAPETGVISSGYNSYGHPTQEVLNRFAAMGMEILRTDELGNVEIILVSINK